MYDIPKFLKRNGDALEFNAEGQFIFYIPEVYFERNYALVIGEFVNLIGILDYTIEDSKGKNNGLHPFKFPTVFLTRPGEMEKVKDIKLTEHTAAQDYRLLKYKKGDQIVVSVKVPKIVDNAEEFYKMFLYGKLPTTIKYDELQNYFIENIRLNGADYGLNMQMFGIIVSEIARDPNDITKLFRYTDMKDMCAYQAIDIKQIPKYLSAYTSFTSENFDAGVVNAIMNKNQKYTPLEKLLTQ